MTAPETALHGLKVIEIANFVSGPLIGQILADLGAEVTKVEKIDGGDDSRALPPLIDGDGYFFAQYGRNKRSVAINLKEPRGAELVLGLLRDADVVIDNFRPGALLRAGIDYDAIRVDNPGLISCSVTGFGVGNRYTERAAYDPILQGMAGLMMATGFDGDPPVRAGSPVVDLTTALLGTIGVLAALQERASSGGGQHVDVSLLGASALLMGSSIFSYWAGGKAAKRGTREQLANSLVPVVETADDRAVTFSLGNYGIFRRFCAAAGREELLDDPRFADMQALSQHMDELGPVLVEAFRGRDFDFWDEALTRAGIPWGPVNDVVQFFEDDVVQEAFVGAVSRNGAPIPAIKTPISLSRSGQSEFTPPVSLGADTQQILKDRLGQSAEQLATLRELGVIG